jgi:O-antigen ligase
VQNTETIKLEPEWFQKPKLLISTVAIVFAAWLGIQIGLWSLLSLVLIIQGVLFILAFRRPVWAVAALLVGQLTASQYFVLLPGGTQITARFLWTILAVILLIPLLRARGGIKLGSKARFIIIPTIIFYCLATAANSVNLDMPSVFQYLRTGATALGIIIFLPAVVKDEKDLRLLTIVVLVTCSISALAAVMQHYRDLGLPVYTLGGGIHKGRVPGLSGSPLNLAYELPLAILPMFALLLMRGVSRSMKKILLVLILVMLAALYFTFTRSGMYSLLPGILVMFFILRGRMRKVIFAILLVLGAGFLLYTNMVGNRYSQGFNEESSAAGRLVLWQAGAMIAMDNPIFGIGQGRFIEVSEAYSSEVDVNVVEGAMGALGEEQVHNDFIRVWVSFGTPALLVYLWVFIVVFRTFYYGYRRSSSVFIKAIAFGGCGALMAYIVNAFSHNLMDSVPLLWILAGFSIAVTKLADIPKVITIPEKAANVSTTNRSPGSSSPRT